MKFDKTSHKNLCRLGVHSSGETLFPPKSSKFSEPQLFLRTLLFTLTIVQIEVCIGGSGKVAQHFYRERVTLKRSSKSVRVRLICEFALRKPDCELYIVSYFSKDLWQRLVATQMLTAHLNFVRTKCTSAPASFPFVLGSAAAASYSNKLSA